MLFLEVDMNKIKLLYHYFSGLERTLWCSSVLLILLSFIIFDRENFLMLAASLIGVTSLVFNAKGTPFGQLLMVVFALISWLKHPYNGNRAEVSMEEIRYRQWWYVLWLSLSTAK